LSLTATRIADHLAARVHCAAGLSPDLAVIVATVRALKLHGGADANRGFRRVLSETAHGFRKGLTIRACGDCKLIKPPDEDRCQMNVRRFEDRMSKLETNPKSEIRI